MWIKFREVCACGFLLRTSPGGCKVIIALLISPRHTGQHCRPTLITIIITISHSCFMLRGPRPTLALNGRGAMPTRTRHCLLQWMQQACSHDFSKGASRRATERFDILNIYCGGLFTLWMGHSCPPRSTRPPPIKYRVSYSPIAVVFKHTGHGPTTGSIQTRKWILSAKSNRGLKNFLHTSI